MVKDYRMTRRAALLVGGALLGVHMVISALSQAPLSPAKLKYGNVVVDYLSPYFAQNWMLFAPTPLSEGRGIIARAKCENGRVSRFYDVSSRGLQKMQHSRFFPSREVRIVSGNLQQISTNDEVMRRLRQNRMNEKKPAIPLLPQEKVSVRQATKNLSRYAFDQMPTVCAGRMTKIQVRMYTHKMPPWSKRHDKTAKGKVEARDFDWVNTGELR
ncbi:DUF5819 family protein [Streptomyces sioyaensis]|uniref:DUF5819 family protein n=1 Tax=Streptomyces sioyaensis TaxID=67364 RepID=UPI00364A64FF